MGTRVPPPPPPQPGYQVNIEIMDAGGITRADFERLQSKVARLGYSSYFEHGTAMLPERPFLRVHREGWHRFPGDRSPVVEPWLMFPALWSLVEDLGQGVVSILTGLRWLYDCSWVNPWTVLARSDDAILRAQREMELQRVFPAKPPPPPAPPPKRYPAPQPPPDPGGTIYL